MVERTLVIFFAAAMCTSSAHAENAPAAARTGAWADLVKLLRFAEQPATASIATLARQFEFNYTIRMCSKVNAADDWCTYAVHHDFVRPGEIASASFGHDRTTGLPIAKIVWRIRDSRLCVSRADIETLLGPGEEMLSPMPFLIPGERPPPVMTLFSHPKVRRANAFNVATLYTGDCLTDVTITF